MTTNHFINQLGVATDFTSRQSRFDSLSILYRQSVLRTYLQRLASILLLVLTVGVGNVWGTAATLPIDYSFGGNSYPTGTSGNSLTLQGYVASHDPYRLQFNGTGDYLLLETDSPANQIIFSVKMIGGSTTSTFTVQGSTNNSTFTDIQSFSISGSQNDVVNCTTSVSINTSYRYFKFYFTKGSNVGFGTLKVSKASKYTVTFYKTDGSTEAITEESIGGGVTPPVMSTPCDGWAFQGWSKSQSTSPTSTTVLTKETLTAGKYYPSANTTLYPVYTKAGTASTDLTIVPGSFSSKGTSNYGSGAERTASVNGVNFGAHYITGNAANSPASGKTAGTYIQCQASNANIYNITAFSGSITKVVINQYAAQNFSLYCGSSQLMASNNTSTGQTPSGTAQSSQTAATTMTWNVNAASNYTYFDIKKGSGTSYISSIVITYLAPVTYYYSYPTCCTALASINGSFF